MPKSYNDPAKSLAREKQREFIARNLAYKRPSDIRVLCFPGAEQDGEEGLEIREVYDPLGIPRRNITGLEVDKKRYERLQRAGLGINSVNSSDIGYLERAKNEYGSWDVISLDYTSFFTPDSVYVISLLANDGLLGNRGVLATNFMAQREHDKSQQIIQDHFCSFNLTNQLKTRYDVMREEEQEIELAKKFDLSDHRSETIRQSMIRIMGAGRSALSTDPYRRFGDFSSKLDRMSESQEMKEIIDSLKGRNIDEKLAQTYLVRTIFKKLFWTSFCEVGADMELVDLYWKTQVRPYYAVSTEAYSYVSNSKTPMLFDLGFYDKMDRELRPFEGFFSLRGNNLHVNPFRGTREKKERQHKSAKETSRKLVDLLYNSLENGHREFLGSSYVPRPKDIRERISKEDALELLHAGFPPAEIAEVYRGFSKMQLAAMKAHVTMGTYDKNVPDDSTVEA